LVSGRGNSNQVKFDWSGSV